jgi:uncharacterized protein (DUF305 family)
MRRFRLTLLAITVTLAAGAAWAQQTPAPHRGHGAPPSPGFETEMHAAMSRMSREMEAAPMTGDPDRDFLAMMIPHHQGAVEMARLLLLSGRDPLVRKLAEEILAAQVAEIATMRNRLRILQGGQDPNPGGFPALGGTRGPAPGRTE